MKFQIQWCALALSLLASVSGLAAGTHGEGGPTDQHSITSLSDLFGISSTALNGKVKSLSQVSTGNGDTDFTLTTDDGREILVNVIGWPTSNPNGSTGIHLRGSRYLQDLKGKPIRVIGKMNGMNSIDAKEIWEMPKPVEKASTLNGTVDTVSEISTGNGDTGFSMTTDDGRKIYVNVIGSPTSSPKGSTRLHLYGEHSLSDLEGKSIRIKGTMKSGTHHFDAKEIWEMP